MGVLHEAVVVGPWHADVHVVVPRDETSVAYGSEHRAGPAVVAQTMLATHVVDLQQDLQDVLVQFVYIVSSQMIIENMCDMRK